MISKLDLYKVFCEVCKCESFSKAAKGLYMTQPAVSQSIMQLEAELETRLFTRTAKGVILTSEAQTLFEYASSAINLINIGEKKLVESKKLTSGELKIGVGDTISRYFLIPYLEEFHSKYPNINLEIINRTTLEICDMLKGCQIDIGICNFPIKAPYLEKRVCMDIQDIFVCGQKFKEITDKTLTFEEIAKLPLILLEAKSNSRKYVEKYLLSKGVKITPEIQLGAHDLLLEFAKINLGVACVVKEFSQKYLKDEIVYEVETIEKIPKRSIGFCFLKGASLSPASKRFIEILEMK